MYAAQAKVHRSISGIAALLIALLVITGCSKGGGLPMVTSQTPPPAEVPTATAAPTPTADPEAPDPETSWNATAQQYFNEGMEALKRVRPLPVQSIYRLYNTADDLHVAFQRFDLAIAIDPEFAGAYLGRAQARLLQLLPQEEDVLNDLDTAIRLSPTYAAAYVERGKTLIFRSKKYEEGLADVEKALSLRPDNFDALVVRARYYQEQGDLDKALADFNAAEGVMTFDADTFYVYTLHVFRGRLFLAQGMVTEGMGDLHRAIDIAQGLDSIMVSELAEIVPALREYLSQLETGSEGYVQLEELIARFGRDTAVDWGPINK